ncbi:glucuronate isomerase [Demequina aurantiaca]|uniref:glucuronate isomerase n=1 Tax=Demequina aurantiaca TaxID=676200 RepID=UPI003D35163C
MRTQPFNDAHRLFPSEPGTRAIASDLYDRVAELPILSPHGHVEARALAENRPFANPAELLILKDHYVTRVMHSRGVGLSELGQGDEVSDPRAVWRLFCERWHEFTGTASSYWLTQELSQQFGISGELTGADADVTYDIIEAALASAEFLPQALFNSFNISALATTDDPLDSLEYHAALRDGGQLAGAVLPTFRPDAYIDPASPDFVSNAKRLLGVAGHNSTTFSSFLYAMRVRRDHFIAHGAVSADHGVVEPFTADIDSNEAERLFQGAMRCELDVSQARVLRGHLLFQMAKMSVEDGLVMTIHAGVFRNHHTPTFAKYGPDTGHDIPVRTDFTNNLRPLLQHFGAEPTLNLVLFTVDESAFSRELAPLAGFYPSVYVGAPWWFLDAPDATQRFRSAVTETAGFYKTSGFVDDTRAFLSIPVRHDASRRLDAGFLARLVAEGRVTMPAAERIIVDLVDAIPREVFKL